MGEMEVPHLAKARFGMTGRIDGGRRQRQAWAGTARPRLPLPPQKKINVIPNEAQRNEEPGTLADELTEGNLLLAERNGMTM